MENNLSLDKIISQFKTVDQSQSRGVNSQFISFEGIEGCGKTTQISLLKQQLEKEGRTVTVLREPGGTQFGESLRSAILTSEVKLHPTAEAYLFASSRSQLLFEKIKPLLEEENQIVILDRYIDSSLAYQAMARGLGVEFILNIHTQSPLNMLPDMTFYLEIDTQTSMERQNARGDEKDYFEKENTDFYQTLISGYETSVKLFPKRMKVIDATKTIDEIHNSILRVMK